jgi:hypothetical protein
MVRCTTRLIGMTALFKWIMPQMTTFSPGACEYLLRRWLLRNALGLGVSMTGQTTAKLSDTEIAAERGVSIRDVWARLGLPDAPEGRAFSSPFREDLKD